MSYVSSAGTAREPGIGTPPSLLHSRTNGRKNAEARHDMLSPRPEGRGIRASETTVTIMTTDSTHRSVRLERTENSRYVVTNDRGGQISVGTGEGTGFTPVDLLLAGIGGCTAIDVDILTSRRAEPTHFEVLVDAEKVRDDAGNHLTDIVVTFRVRFPEGEGGDKARALLPDAVRKSHDRLCTVSRTVELGTPVAARIEP